MGVYVSRFTMNSEKQRDSVLSVPSAAAMPERQSENITNGNKTDNPRSVSLLDFGSDPRLKKSSDDLRLSDNLQSSDNLRRSSIKKSLDDLYMTGDNGGNCDSIPSLSGASNIDASPDSVHRKNNADKVAKSLSLLYLGASPRLGKSSDNLDPKAKNREKKSLLSFGLKRFRKPFSVRSNPQLASSLEVRGKSKCERLAASSNPEIEKSAEDLDRKRRTSATQKLLFFASKHFKGRSSESLSKGGKSVSLDSVRSKSKQDGSLEKISGKENPKAKGVFGNSFGSKHWAKKLSNSLTRKKKSHDLEKSCDIEKSHEIKICAPVKSVEPRSEVDPLTENLKYTTLPIHFGTKLKRHLSFNHSREKELDAAGKSSSISDAKLNKTPEKSSRTAKDYLKEKGVRLFSFGSNRWANRPTDFGNGKVQNLDTSGLNKSAGNLCGQERVTSKRAFPNVQCPEMGRKRAFSLPNEDIGHESVSTSSNETRALASEKKAYLGAIGWNLKVNLSLDNLRKNNQFASNGDNLTFRSNPLVDKVTKTVAYENAAFCEEKREPLKEHAAKTLLQKARWFEGLPETKDEKISLPLPGSSVGFEEPAGNAFGEIYPNCRVKKASLRSEMQFLERDTSMERPRKKGYVEQLRIGAAKIGKVPSIISGNAQLNSGSIANLSADGMQFEVDKSLANEEVVKENGASILPDVSTLMVDKSSRSETYPNCQVKKAILQTEWAGIEAEELSESTSRKYNLGAKGRGPFLVSTGSVPVSIVSGERVEKSKSVENLNKSVLSLDKSIDNSNKSTKTLDRSLDSINRSIKVLDQSLDNFYEEVILSCGQNLSKDYLTVGYTSRGLERRKSISLPTIVVDEYGSADSLDESAVYASASSVDAYIKSSTLDARTPTSTPSPAETSYERAIAGSLDRRCSIPIVTEPSNSDENMEGSSSPASRFANFFTKKGFKSNLKRTKSVTKLDRKRAGSALEHDPPPIPTRMRTSRSHESLLIAPSMFHTVDLSAKDTDVRPLHQSLLNQNHCFQVSNKSCHKYYSCRSAAEREKWLQSLRKTMSPNQDQMRRVNNSLQLWVLEAKNVTTKKRYFCEICLDRTLYARTSSKTKGDMLFWGEHFDFNNLPDVEIITVNIYKEAEKKRKKEKNLLLGYINIPVHEVRNRTLVERWYTASSGLVGKGKENKGELPLIRIKARFQTVNILPMEMYQDLIQCLSEDYQTLVDVLEPLVSVKAKEEVATSLVHVFQRLNKVKDLLTNIVMVEIDRLENEHMTFRGNSIATKSIEAFMKLVGEKYLQDTLSEFVKTIIDAPDDCEVDPTRLANPQSLQRNQTNLVMYCEMAWCKIINSFCYFPKELKEVFASFRECCVERNREETCDNLISASIFLRFLCPAILSPSLFGLSQEYPNEKAARNLTLIAKTIQNLANFTKFGGKEEFMTFMNDFVEQEWGTMKSFLRKISTREETTNLLEFDGYVDLGRELSILHSLLIETLDKVFTLQPGEARLTRLTTTLARVTDALDNPSQTLKRKPSSGGAANYDNLSLYSSSSSTKENDTPKLNMRDYNDADLSRVNDKSVMQNLARAHRSYSLTGGSRSGVAHDLNTADDYVLFGALEENPNLSPSTSNRAEIKDLKANEHKLNQSWNQMLKAAEVVNGDVMDLIAFVDEGHGEGPNTSLDQDNGSQISISQVSNVASSGYQSFGYSQSSSPVDPSVLHSDQLTNSNTNSNRSPVTQQRTQPLSFSNPVYRLNAGLAKLPKPSKASRSSSVSSEDDGILLTRMPTPPKNVSSKPPTDLAVPRMNTINSASEECLTMPPSGLQRHHRSASLTSAPGFYRSVSNSTSPLSPNHPMANQEGFWYKEGNLQTNNLSQSVDLTSYNHHNQQQQRRPMRRTSTDTVISQSQYQYPDGRGATSPPESPRYGSLTYSQRRASLPQNNVRMGVRIVQRKLHEQEKTKEQVMEESWYESELNALSKMLAETQHKLQDAECRLTQQDSSKTDLMREWQQRLVETESAVKRQQMEKEEQSKHLIQRYSGRSESHLQETQLRQQQQQQQLQRPYSDYRAESCPQLLSRHHRQESESPPVILRHSQNQANIKSRLVGMENELRREQTEMSSILSQKQNVITSQEKRIHNLDVANSRLLGALGQLKDRYTVPSRNGIANSNMPRAQLSMTESGEFKNSSC
ncbi:ras GTPase-activating protein nGAP-like isoform X4 [Lineus longissimus]|uniref:ras GTPase-activating protein nGAP-like isoform X4 n=1 Tax=Lineus longissimus TaxID=88925 RepID=UPI00315CA845